MTRAGSRTARSSGRALPDLVLRPATAADADLLLEWANEPAVRTASLRRDPIDRPTHLQWLAERLADPRCRVWIGSAGGKAVGVVRFEGGDDGRATVSVSVAVASRGRGLGQALLEAGLARARSELRPAGFRAHVRVDNAASLRLFQMAGFRPDTGGPKADGILDFLQDIARSRPRA